MRRTIATTTTGRRRVPAVLVAVAVLAAGSALVGEARPTAAQIVVDPASDTRLVVAPGPRTPADSGLVLTAAVVDAEGAPAQGTVSFRVDATLVAEVALDAGGQAVATATPPVGAHRISASYAGTVDLRPSSAVVEHSVLPATCAEAAAPGAAAWVRLAYLVLLGRCPDAPGAAHWAAVLDAGTAPATVARRVAAAPEGAPAVVDDAFRRVLGRAVDPAGAAFWVARRRAGWTTARIWAALAASPEMGTLAGADPVAAAYLRLLGRPADAAGHAYWSDRLRLQPGWRTWLALVRSAEALAVRVDEASGDALGRPATPAERAAADAGAEWRPVAVALLGTDAAVAHAQTYPDLPGRGD